MHAMLATFNLGPGMRETADKLAEYWDPAISSLKGFKRATFIGDAETGEYAALVVLETKEDAEAAMAETEAAFQEQIGSISKEPPKRKIYEVWRAL